MTSSTFDALPFGALAAKLVRKSHSRKSRAKYDRGDSLRTGQPVWRNSYYEGTFEHRIWRPIGDGKARGGKRFAGAVLKAAKAFELRTRAKRRETDKGCQNGALGAIGIEVLEVLYDLVDFMTGRLDPAIATIAERIERSYSAVHDALRRLRDAGFLHWIRRTRKLNNKGEAGPQLEQVSNAYALTVPKEMEGYLSRLFGKAPAPACDQARRDLDHAEFRRMVERLTAREYHEHFWSGDQLAGETMRRISEGVDRRVQLQERESDRPVVTGGVLHTP